MICTESNAKTKWCPQVRFVPNNEGTPSNRHSPDDGGADDKDMVLNPAYARCIGSTCMFWEWVDADTVELMDGRYTAVSQNERRGTCGLINRSAT